MEIALSTTMDEDTDKNYSTIPYKLHNVTLLITLSEREKLTSSLLLSVIIFIGSLTNPIMVMCIQRTWSSNSSVCRHLLHLAVGDMIKIFFCLPIRIASFFELIPFGWKNVHLFQIRIFLDIFTEILHFLILLLISSDRYYAVARPFNKCSNQKMKTFFILVCTWSLAIVGASFASYFYEDYLTCKMEIPLYVYMLSFLVFQSSIVIGILQFYLRTIYFLWERKKMQTLRRKRVSPFSTHSEIEEKKNTDPKKILPTSMKGNENKMTNDVVHPRVVEVAVSDLKYPETKIPQTERPTDIKIDSDLSKGLSDSANIPLTSLVLVPSNLSTDINERSTNREPQKEKSETLVTDLKSREKEHTQMDIAADSIEYLENSQEADRAQRLDIVINCTLNGIATKTEIVDSQNTLIINPNKEQSSLCQVNDIGETKVKPRVNSKVGVIDERAENEDSENDCDSIRSTIETEKLFIISQQVEFTVNSFTTLSDVKRPRSYSALKHKTESDLQLEKGFVISADDNKEAIKSDDQPSIRTESPAQTKVYEQIGNKTATLTGKEGERNRNGGAKFPDNNLSSTASEVTPLENKIGQTFQVTNTNIVGPFCPLPKRSKLKQRYHKEVMVTQRIAILIIILLVCWMPLYVTRFLQISFLLGKQCYHYKPYRILWWESLSASTSAFNPCLYGVLHTHLRNEFCRLMRRFRDLLMNYLYCK